MLPGQAMTTDPLIVQLQGYAARHPQKRVVLAEKIGISKSALDKFFIGLGGPVARRKVEAFLSDASRPLDIAAEHLGSYSRAQAGRYIGDYVFMRPDFRDPEAIALFRVGIDWDERVPGLRFRGVADGRFEKIAYLTIPRGSMYIQAHHNQKGWCSLMVLTQIDGDGRMYGTMLAMGDLIGSLYLPMFTPVCYWKTRLADLGIIGKGHRLYETCRGFLDVPRAEGHFKVL
jgi:hypothetical protein